MKRITYCLSLILIAAFVLSGSAWAQSQNDNPEYARRFSKMAGDALAPVYGPLADYLVSEYALESRVGTGLDIGGGPGSLSVELAKRTTGMNWITSDINPSFFPYAAENAKRNGVVGRISFSTADAQRLPFRDNYADIVVSRGSFQFWGDLENAFSEIYRVLKPRCPAYIGRGFPANLPVDVARNIRKNHGSGPSYDKAETAAILAETVEKLGITDFRVILPEPAAADGINYGVWIEFFKAGPRSVPKTVRVSGVSTAAAQNTSKDERLYVIEPFEVRGTSQRDIIAEPLSESASLEISTTVIEREDIERQGAKNVIEALNYVPGAWVETRGRKVKQFFSVRGQKYPYPEYAVDGALFREFHEVPYFFSTADIERIEVLRSSAAMLSGVSGLAGVVNIVPRRYDKPETSWDIEYGSFESYRTRLSHGASHGTSSYSLSVDTPHTDGPDGKNAAENMSNAKVMLSFKPRKDLDIRANIFHINGKRELMRAEAPAATRFQETVERFDPFRTTFANLRALYTPAENKSTELQFFYADRDHYFQNDSASGHTTVKEWDYEWGINLAQSYALTENNTARASFYYNRWVAPNGKRFFVGKSVDIERFSGTVADEHRFDRLTVDAALRLERSYINEYGAFNINGSGGKFKKVEPIENSWDPLMVNLSIGAAWRLSPVFSLFGNLASGQIRPREGTLDADLNTPDNESRIKLDAGVKAQDSGLGEVALVAFLSRQDNAIVLSGATTTLATGIMELYMNRDQFQSGIEFDAKSASIAGIGRFFLNATMMNPEMNSGSGWERNKEMPRFIASAGVTADYSYYDMGLYMKRVSGYESTRFAADASIPANIGDYTTLNLTLGASLQNRLASRLYLEIDNITDEEFSTVLGFPDFGRRYTVGIRQSF